MSDVKEFTVSLPLDPEGYFGRQCPREDCRKHFQVYSGDFKNFTEKLMFCAYCGTKNEHNSFHTNEQMEYMKSIVARKFLKEITPTLKSMEVRPEPNALISIGISVQIPDIQIKNYLEQQIRKKIVCSNCNRKYAVYGISFYCPFCGERDAMAVFNENMQSINNFLDINSKLDKKTYDLLREEGTFDRLVEKSLDMVVTAFETYCKTKYVDKKLSVNPSLDKNSLLASIGNTFQNLQNGNKIFSKEFSFSFINVLSKEKFAFASKCFQKRHVLVHNSGIIDKKYIDNTGEDPKLIGQRVIVNKKEVSDLINIIDELVNALWNALK